MKTILKIFYWLAGIIALLVLVSFLLPKKYHVERETMIGSKPEIVYMLASDFRLWNLWVPWTKETDSTADFQINGEPGKSGTTWTWKGDILQEGQVCLTEMIPGKLISYDLFFEEGKYKSIGRITIEQLADSCKVTWMDEGDLGYNPMARYMGLLMDGMMGPDFEKGLAKLALVAEGRKDWPVIEEINWPEHPVLIIRDSAGPESYASVMGKAYGEISNVAIRQKLEIKGAPFAIYHKWDSVTMFAVMDLGIPVVADGKSEGRIKAERIPAQKVVQAHYFGPYEKTAGTYHILDQYLKETGLESSGGPWEIYVTDPMAEKDTTKWETLIVFPVK